MAFVAVVMGLRSLLGFGAATDGTVRLNPYLVQALAVLTTAGFFCWFWLKNGQTLGMQAWRIRLVSSDGTPLTAGRVVLRCAAAVLSAACLGLGYLWCLVDRRRRYWHDYLSGTELVLVPKNQRRASTDPAPTGAASADPMP